MSSHFFRFLTPTLPVSPQFITENQLKLPYMLPPSLPLREDVVYGWTLMHFINYLQITHSYGQFKGISGHNYTQCSARTYKITSSKVSMKAVVKFCLHTAKMYIQTTSLLHQKRCIEVLGTVTAPLTAKVNSQELLFWGLDYHIKMHKKSVLA